MKGEKVIEKVIRLLKQKGYSSEETAAIVGFMMYMSGNGAKTDLLPDKTSVVRSCPLVSNLQIF